MKKLFITPGVKGVFIGAILFLIFTALVWRPIMIHYYQQQAGKIIDQVANTIEGSDLVSYRCFLGKLLDETISPELEKASCQRLATHAIIKNV